MKVRFFGTRGSLPASCKQDVFHDKLKAILKEARSCVLETDAFIEEFIKAHDTGDLCKTFGTNTCCVELETGCADQYLLLDAGTGLRDFSEDYVKKGLMNEPATFHFFISHLHWDHIQGFPFFMPLYESKQTIIIHGCHSEMEAAFSRQMMSPHFPVSWDAVKGNVKFDVHSDGKPFDVCGFHVSAIQQNHPGVSYGYRFEKAGKTVVYSTDCEHAEDNADDQAAFVHFFRYADLLIFDAMYSSLDASTLKMHWGHSDNLFAARFACEARVKQLVLYHHEATHSDAMLERFYHDTVQYANLYQEGHSVEHFYLPKIAVSYDGMILDV
jgi:phosphoribosyl 1,2-cyclic phosphodiesterase